MLTCYLCLVVSGATCASVQVCSTSALSCSLGLCPVSLSACHFLPGCRLPESSGKPAVVPGTEPGLHRHECPQPVRSCHSHVESQALPEKSDTSFKVNLWTVWQGLLCSSCDFSFPWKCTRLARDFRSCWNPLKPLCTFNQSLWLTMGSTPLQTHTYISLPLSSAPFCHHDRWSAPAPYLEIFVLWGLFLFFLETFSSCPQTWRDLVFT